MPVKNFLAKILRCLNCDASFKQNSIAQKYCSKKCQVKAADKRYRDINKQIRESLREIK